MHSVGWKIESSKYSLNFICLIATLSMRQYHFLFFLNFFCFNYCYATILILFYFILFCAKIGLSLLGLLSPLLASSYWAIVAQYSYSSNQPAGDWNTGSGSSKWDVQALRNAKTRPQRNSKRKLGPKKWITTDFDTRT